MTNIQQLFTIAKQQEHLQKEEVVTQQTSEFGAVQLCSNRVDLEACCKMSIWSQKVGFYTAENEPPEVSMMEYRTRQPLHSGCGLPFGNGGPQVPRVGVVLPLEMGDLKCRELVWFPIWKWGTTIYLAPARKKVHQFSLIKRTLSRHFGEICSIIFQWRIWNSCRLRDKKCIFSELCYSLL